MCFFTSYTHSFPLSFFRSHSLDEIIVLLIYIYSLMGDECSHSNTEERNFQECLMDAILAEDKPSDLITELGKNALAFLVGSLCLFVLPHSSSATVLEYKKLKKKKTWLCSLIFTLKYYMYIKIIEEMKFLLFCNYIMTF